MKERMVTDWDEINNILKETNSILNKKVMSFQEKSHMQQEDPRLRKSQEHTYE